MTSMTDVQTTAKKDPLAFEMDDPYHLHKFVCSAEGEGAIT